MAVPAGVKLDDGTGQFISKCFPARNIIGSSDDAGAWLVAHRAEQNRRFKAILTTSQTKTYSQIKQERKQKGSVRPIKPSNREEDGVTPGLLDGFFLLKHCCVDDPSELCSVHIASQDLMEVEEEDLQLFNNVAYVNAAENMLPFEAFKSFSNLRELELPLNGLRGLQVSFEDFPNLEVLDLSHNNLSKEDILCLGLLPKLRILYLTGNQLRSLPPELSKFYSVSTGDSGKTFLPRFALLEVLHLDDNHLENHADFASLAGLRRLKRLNLEKNGIVSVPHLKPISAGKHVTIESPSGSAASTARRKKRSKSARKKEGSRSATPESGTITDRTDDVHASQSQLDDIQAELELELSSVADLFKGNDADDSLLPPFPELQFLSLAHNEIMNEEDLLALAAWPMLTELDIHDNPLTNLNSGDPPLLKRYLVDRLGINMDRKTPKPLQKPSIQIATSKERKVVEVPRPLPKRPLSELLMIENTPINDKTQQDADVTTPQPLPPIAESPQLRPRTEPYLSTSITEDSRARPKTWSDGTKTWSAGSHGKENDLMQKEEDISITDEPVFLTQVDNQEEENTNVNPEESKDHLAVHHEKVPSDRPSAPSKSKSFAAERKFKGYEILMDAEDDPDVYIQKDIQGNLRSLKLALNHKPVYRNQVDLDKLQKPFQPYQKIPYPPKPPHMTKAEKLEEVLEVMNNRVTVTEENLAKILEDKQKLKQEYPEVPKMLKEIQAKYKAVRAASMKDNQAQQRSLEDALDATKRPTLMRTSRTEAR